MRQLDVKTAFLHSEIDEEVYIEPQTGLELLSIQLCNANQVLQLMKGLYGLKRAPKIWNDKWNAIMKLLKFEPLKSDPCIFRREDTWILLYVYDILVISAAAEDIDATVVELNQHIDVNDLGNLHQFLGVRFVKDGRYGWLSPGSYARNILERFGMQDCKPVNTPMSAPVATSDTSARADQTLFREMLGSLLFLSTQTRPDISTTVGLLSRHASNPRALHMVGLKRILRYLKRTIDFGLHMSVKGERMVAFADADWGGDATDRKSTSGHLIQVGGCTVLQRTRKQNIVTMSTAEAKFMSPSDLCKDVVWLRTLLEELRSRQPSSTVLFGDNQTAMCWAQQGIRNAKHFAVRRHYLLDMVRDGIVKLQYCPSSEMVADVFTKPLLRVVFQRHRNALGVHELLPSILE